MQIINRYGQNDLELGWNTQSGGGSTSNQNDLGQQTLSLIPVQPYNPPNFPLPLNGGAPIYSGVDYAELRSKWR